MNLSSVDRILPLIMWLLTVLEVILALYVLLLNAWHTANRHLSVFLLCTAASSFATGLAIGAQDITQAIPSTIVLAAVSPVVQIVMALASLALLKPDWLRGRWSRLWWIVYFLAFLPIPLTIVDVQFGTGLWYTGLDPETYVGGYPSLADYTAGSLSSIIMPFYFYLMALLPIALAVYVILFDKKVSRLTRRLAPLVLAVQVIGVIVQMGLQDVVSAAVRAFVMAVLIVVVYTYVAFQQIVSERRAQRGRLPIRLTAIILAIAVPLIVSVVLFSAVQAEGQIREGARQRLQGSNRALGANVSVWLDLNIKALQQLVALPGIVSMDAAQQKPILEAMDAAYPHMYLVSTTDLSGLNIARSDAADPKDYSDRSWFLGPRDGAALTFQTLVGRTSGEPALVVSMPIRNASGEIVGVGMFASDLTDLAQEVIGAQVGQGGIAYVVDADNRVIAHPDPTFTAELRDLSPYPPVIALREGSTGVESFTDEEGAHWQAYAEELAYGWGVVVQQREEELIGPLLGFQMNALGATIISTITLGILVSLAIRQALSPVNSLASTATAIAGGDLTRVAPVESEDEIGALARVFNSMTEQLRELIGSLEQRVDDRTQELERRARYLEASSQVARAAVSMLEPQQLLEQIVSLVTEQFGFYHAGIFLIAGEWAVLRAASSEGGQRMLARGHRLKVGELGIVGYVTGRGEPRIALDVGADAVYFDNPDMPDTRSEMALPLRARGEIIGALDVQSREPEAFSSEDVTVLQTLADQVAMAISNAQLLQQVQTSLEAERRAYGEISREAWAQIVGARELSYRCDERGVSPVGDLQVGDSDLPEVSLPITVRGQVLGMVKAHKPAGVGGWTAEDATMMKTLVDRLEQALESARIYQDIQRRAAREQATREITDTIRGAISVEDAVQRAVREMGRVLGASEVVARVGTERDLLSSRGDGADDSLSVDALPREGDDDA